ncbi:probable myosin-binding protein 5 isoform X1 [Solanum verrucosum]|uniref:probable myosin-binding protein 5 isoform X1 n=1 Tax=Solanum verrucosum TaxID=315347 RepID=UPI0020D1EA52|nr:probable myosin-binding protein 5 isoform X1 [Solanum verrucosum]XP_049366263.1 probable myosin-binding protein 5 isoform X1 [Solanum verrucosum]
MASRSFKCLVEQKLGRVGVFCVYAVLEWVMILLLFIDGFLALFTNEFAKFFELKVPCLLCTRIDHIFIKRNSSFYYNESICEGHKKDISSLAYCHVHKKLSDIRNMCEGCLLSFATEKEADCDKYKSLVGILHKDIDCFVDDDKRMSIKSVKNEEEATKTGSVVIRNCSCCGEPLKLRTKYVRNSSINGNHYSQAPASSPRSPLTWKNEESGNMELPHIQYTKLKFSSDNESILPDDEGHQNAAGKEDTKAATAPLLPDPEDIHDESCKTPVSARNKFFGIPLTDSAQASPKWPNKPRKLGGDKSEFISDANDTSAVNEADDDILHSLKRQVRLDRKSLMELYMELDEERSASAVAANNAMAMITRLQAEKAAVQMEALQYQRMMEEQAEYDQEALQVMKDLVLKREEEIKVLEAEMDTYRERYGVIKKVGSEVCEVDADDDYQELRSQSASSFDERSDCSSPREVDHNGVNEFHIERPGEYRDENVDESNLDFENERSYLQGLLANLEKKIKIPPDVESHVLESNVIQDKGNDNKVILTREVSLLRERLRAVEAESGFLKHAAMTLQRGREGTKLLNEIAQHLRELRYTNTATEVADA